VIVKFYIKNLKFWILKQLSDYKLVTFIFDVIFFCHLNGNKKLLKMFFCDFILGILIACYRNEY
jgi:hypothetical protein